MTLKEMSEPILIEQSKADSRSLIMPHQQKAVEAMTDYYRLDQDIEGRNGLLVMPTGAGKTYTAVTWLLSEGVAQGYTIVWLVHRQELVTQTYREFRKQAPILQATGVKKLRVLAISGVHMKMSMANKANVYVCSIASVANKYGYRFIERMLGAAGKRKLIIVVDEAHHTVAANYQKVINRMTALNKNRVLLGMTATPKRMQESEQKKLQKIYSVNENLQKGIGVNGYVYEVTLKQLLLSGYLAQPIYERVNTEIIGEIAYNCTPEDEEFFLQYGELSEKLKSQIASSSVRNKKILEQYLNNKDKYGKTIVFAVNQLHAETLCNEFREAGITCDYAVSDRRDSGDVIQRFKDNEFKVLINVQILTEGSDVPDIQTVFLTRQTNSDSLLMQMIGRGLRGEKAGGTKEAHIVSFHDTWNTFAHWLDPGALDIFIEEAEEEQPEELEEKVEISPDEEMLELLRRLWEHSVDETTENNMQNEEVIAEEPEIEQKLSARELYLKLYKMMKVSLSLEGEIPVYPCGWYSVVDEKGDNIQILVFDCQLSAYQNIERNIKQIKGKLNADKLGRYYFRECDKVPDFDELDLLLEYIEETDQMPPYFTFEMRDALNPKEIAEKVSKLFEKEEDREKWLKDLYDRSGVLQQIYHYFYAFKKTIYDAMKVSYEAKIETTDDREEYEIVENYHNLQELFDEVKEMYPLLRTEGLVKLAWSDSIVRAWFGLCERVSEDDGMEYQIHINRLLCSPQVDREVIKYLIFHELLHENGYWSHDDDFRKREWQYPNSEKLDGDLDTLMLKYNVDSIMEGSVYFETYAKKKDVEESEELAGEHSSQSGGDSSNEKLPKGVQIGYKYCRNCGNKLPDTAKFCDKCGEKMDY